MNKGQKHTDITKQKISILRKGNQGWKLRKKEGMLGRKHTEESREKMRLNSGTKDKPSWNRGKKFTKDARLKMSIARKNKTYEEFYGKTKANLLKMKRKQSRIGYIHSEETKKKIGLGNRGKVFSLSSRKKLSATKQKIKLKDWKKFIGQEPYSQNWNNKFKNFIRKRDNQICMLCNIHREKLKIALDVHHVNYDKQLTIKENCISLCHKCHTCTNTNRKYWITFFQSLLNEKYKYQYSNNNIVINLDKIKK